MHRRRKGVFTQHFKPLGLKSEPNTLGFAALATLKLSEQLGTSKEQTVPMKTSVMLPGGELFRDEKGEP